MQMQIFPNATPVTRRVFVAGSVLALASFGTVARANTVIGKALEVRGEVNRKQQESAEVLAVGGDVLDLSLIHISSPRDRSVSRMPSSA